jgi:hypothetical protein
MEALLPSSTTKADSVTSPDSDFVISTLFIFPLSSSGYRGLFCHAARSISRDHCPAWYQPHQFLRAGLRYAGYCINSVF